MNMIKKTKLTISILSIVLLILLTVRVNAQSKEAFEKLGLIEVTELDSTIAIDLRYATPNNFMGKVLYDSLREAYLLPLIAERLVAAQKLLLEQGYSLVVLDAARPVSVQWQMWNKVKGTPEQKYVANPSKGGMHNFGAAVDVTIVDLKTGVEPNMGSAFDHFGEEAWTLPQHETPARKILIDAMQRVGLRPLKHEWWHYEINEWSYSYVQNNYKIIDL